MAGALLRLRGRGSEELWSYLGRGMMGKKICQVCGCDAERTATEEHYIVPMEVTEQAGIPKSKIVKLCPNCHRELHRWYSIKVAAMAYDTKMKRFRAKSPLEMVEEYQAAYGVFVQYKKGQPKGA